PVHKIMEMLTDTRDDRPIILVEYLYQISNSGGGMGKFRELLEKYPRFQGGYVWDWQDKCLIAKTPEGKEFFAYGGDFNESYVEHDCPPFMTCNGIVLPDLVWKPVAYEVKQAYAPLDIRRPSILSPWQTSCGENDYVLRADPGISLEEYRCKGVLKENGVEIGEREITLSPEMTRGFTFSIPHTKKPGCEYHMDFLITRKTAPWFADAGDTVSATQCTLTGGGAAVVQPLSQKGVTLVETPTTAEISVADFVCIFNKENGAVISAKKKGKEYLKNSIRPCFSRPKTGIDAQPGWGWYQEYNGFSDLTEQLISAEILHSEQAVTAVFQLAYVREATVLAKAKLSYRVGGEGKIALTYTASAAPHIKIIPRVGVELVVPEGFEQLSYFGFGENENYCDRLESARLGVYESTVEGQNFPFIPPAENGGHEGTRWLSLGDGQGSRLKISGADPFHFDAHHNTIGEYRAARHDHELVRHGETYLHIDAAHSQIGSEMAWSTQLDPAFHLGGKSLTAYWEIELT
ncbi:MAG: glycoside hydrolase family 2 TIM barrel-domain containing protein, partial [Oscillospiraceae bacterium]